MSSPSFSRISVFQVVKEEFLARRTPSGAQVSQGTLANEPVFVFDEGEEIAGNP
jgi:hypothetical protein